MTRAFFCVCCSFLQSCCFVILIIVRMYMLALVCLMQNNDLRKQLASLRHELQEVIQMRETAVADQTKAQQALQQQVELAAEVWILLGITDCFNGALLTALEQTYCTSQVFCWGMLGYFRVSIIHQTVTQTTWSSTWVCDRFAWGTLVYSLIRKTFVVECAQNLTLEKLLIILDFPAVGVFFYFF